MKHYGQATPPEYDLSKVNAKMIIFYGDMDLVYNKDDALLTIDKLGSNVVATENLPAFNHLDFVFGKSANTMVYDKIINHLKKSV